jgi:hypothetical protein
MEIYTISVKAVRIHTLSFSGLRVHIDSSVVCSASDCNSPVMNQAVMITTATAGPIVELFDMNGYVGGR